MHPFCISFPYGALLAVGGLIGYLKSGSMISLAAGGGFGAAVMGLAYLELGEYKSRGGYYSPNYARIILMMNIVLNVVMGKRFLDSGYKVMPAGMVFFVSLAATFFYVNRLFISPLENMKADDGKKAKKSK